MAKKNIFHPEYSLMPATALRARQLGVMHYFTGMPCKRGHISPRYASSGNCAQCIAEKRGQAFINIKGRSSKRDSTNQGLAIKAVEAGATTYESTTACPQGHITRYVGSNNCVECSRMQMEKRAESSRWKRIERLYSITKDQYMSMLFNQKEECAICSKKMQEKEVHVDHCHQTGRVRGLLCSRCNQAIGLLDEDLERINMAAEYIKGHSREAKRLSAKGN